MNGPDHGVELPETHRSLTLKKRELALRSEGREAAAHSVRRIQLEGAARLATLKARYANELARAKKSARSTTRRMTSGFSIALFVGAASFLATLVKMPELAPDVAFERFEQFEVAGVRVAVAAAEAESEIESEPAGASTPKPTHRQPTLRVRPVSRPVPSATVDPCTGDPYDPLNFCL